MSDIDEKQTLEAQSAGGADISAPDEPAVAPDPDNGPPLDLHSRQLCGDGTCIGVIGPDGRCKECGREAVVEELSAAPSDSETAVAEDQPGAEPDSSSESVASDEDWENRRLCVDGNCIGVVGVDGKCKLCGKSAG